MSPSDISPIEEEGADVDGADREGADCDGVEREGKTVESCHDLNCASLHFTVVTSMAHMKVKWSDKGKGIEKLRKILMIAEGKISLSWDAESK